MASISSAPMAGAKRGRFRSVPGQARCLPCGPRQPRHALGGGQPKDGAPAIFHSEDEGETWLRCGDLPACERAWHVRPGRSDENGRVWAGVMPATLLRSDDRGQTWQDVPGLNAHPSRPEWWPGGGGLCMHTVILPEGQPGRVYAGISVAGFFRSDDDGETWTPPTREVVDGGVCRRGIFRRQGGASRRPPLRAQGRARSDKPRDALHAAARRGLPLR